jgi:hypothetical protein
MRVYTLPTPTQFAIADGSTGIFTLTNPNGYPIVGPQVLEIWQNNTKLSNGYNVVGTTIAFSAIPPAGTVLKWRGSYSRATGYFPNEECPFPVRDSYSGKYGTQFKRTVMDDGHGRYRRQWAAQSVANTLNWQMNWDQLDFFEAFLKYECSEGTGFFTMQLYPGGPLQTYRMTAYPQIAFDDSVGAWVISANVEYIRTAPMQPPRGNLPVFPDSLPQPEKGQYQITRPDQITRSNITQGEANQRTRWTDEVGIFTVNWILDETQYYIWDGFVHDTLIGGLAPFQGWFANGQGTSLTRIRFLDTPQVQSQGAAFAISAQCEIQQIPVMSEADYIGHQQLFYDTITYSESISFTISLGVLADGITYSESLSFNSTRPMSDTITYSESSNIQRSGYSNFGDAVTMSETVSFSITPAPYTDSITFGVSGGITVNDYIDGSYIEFGYFGTTTPFVN